MTREIKFRAWDGERMRPVTLWGFSEEFVMTPRGSSGIEDYKIMQYTGLNDKNGKEIYEGDIVKWAENGNYEVVFGYGNNEATKIGAFCLKGTEMFLHTILMV